MSFLLPSFCSFRAQNRWSTVPRANALGYKPIGLSARLCWYAISTVIDNTSVNAFCNSHGYEQWRGEALQDNSSKHCVVVMVTSNDGAKSCKITLQDIIQQLTLRAIEERSLTRWPSKTLYTSKRLRAIEERSLIRWHSKKLCTSKRFRAKAGRSPKRNIAHGNTMGNR